MQFEAISIEGLSHRFLSKNRSPTVALTDVSVQFPAGKVTSIVGPSGCGKSTLLLIMRGLVEATDGTVHFLYGNGAGQPLPGAPPRMATVWQSFNLLPWRNVIDNV